MDITDIKGLIFGLKVYEERTAEEDFLEVVFLTSDMGSWIEVLSGCLGEPIKPAGIKPNKAHLALTKEYRGIESNQILFAKDFDGRIIVAMLWPWSNGDYITLKLFKKQ